MVFVESEKIELKQKLSDSIEKEIVAFLNTDGGAIYIGVEDDGKIRGIENLDSAFKKISDMIATGILPECKDLVELGSKYIDGKTVIEIKVAKGDSLYYIKRYGRSSLGCFKRVGTTCLSMSEKQIESLHTKILDSKIKITSLRGKIKNPTFQYLKILCLERGLKINDETFAQNLCLKNDDGDWNLMSDLLCDKNGVSIKVVRFAGNAKGTRILLRNEYGEKCLVVAMKQAFEYCADVLNQTKTVFSNGIRNDVRLFDKDAFREVWFNACLHNNWIDGTPPAIYVFNNRLEIVSTGGLPANLSQEDFFAGISKPINEELAKIFIRLGLIEQTGYGVPFVAERYGKAIFEFHDFFLRVTIPFGYILEEDEIEKGQETGEGQEKRQEKGQETEEGQEKRQEKGQETEEGQEKRQEKGQETEEGQEIDFSKAQQIEQRNAEILKEIKDNPAITMKELENKFGLSTKQIRLSFEKLNIVREGGDNGGYWKVM